MRIVSASLVAFALAGLAGCHRSEPGGGADKAHQFTLSGPTTSTTIRRGETQTVQLKVNRGKEFNQDVKLSLENPSGVDAALDMTTYKASDKVDSIPLKITAKDNAPLGENKITVTAKPTTGAATTLDVALKITEASSAASLSFSGPLTATHLKQGETKTIDVTLKHPDKLNGTAKIKAECPDKGITVELVNSTVKSSDSGNVGMKVTASKEAAIGEHTIHLTATPDNGNVTVTPLDVKVKVEAP